MKKIIISLILLMTLVGCTNNGKINNSLKFKEEYESLNGKVASNGKEHRTIYIPSNNPFLYKTAEDIVKYIENGETFYVYFGDTQCPWCRSVIEKAIESMASYEIKKVYYVKIWDDDHNEILRDTYKVNESGKPELENKGTDSYYKLLQYFDNVLSDYSLSDSNGNKVTSFEKRIYAPNFIYVKEGKAVSLVTGISESQSDSREELTEEILADEGSQFTNFFSKSSSCNNDVC